MKISSPTLGILKNFATINSNIVIKPGNALSTISAGKDIFVKASVAETFPSQVPIYDLNSLLGLLSLADDLDVEFGDKSLKLTKEDGEFEYFYSDPSVTMGAPDKTIPVDEHFTFKLSGNEINMILKAAAIVSAPKIVISGKRGKATLVVGDPSVAASNSYKKSLGKCDVDFDFRLQVENFKVIPENYAVTISTKKFIHLKSEVRDLQYWLAVDPSSSV